MTRTIETFEGSLQTLLKPWATLSAEELVAIGAEKTIAAIAAAWDANSLALRSLLLPVPRIIRALPTAGGKQ